MVGHVFCHHRPCTDEGVTADGISADDRTVGPQGRAFLDKGGADLVHLGDFRPGIEYVGEDHGGAAEDAIFEGDTFVNAHVILDLASIADGDIGTNDDVLANIAVLADFGTGEDVGEVPDFCFFTNFHITIYHGGFVGEKISAEG